MVEVVVKAEGEFVVIGEKVRKKKKVVRWFGGSSKSSKWSKRVEEVKWEEKWLFGACSVVRCGVRGRREEKGRGRGWWFVARFVRSEESGRAANGAERTCRERS